LNKWSVLTVTIVISALMLSFIAFPLSVTAQAPDFIPGKTQVVSAFGKVPGQDLIVHVLVLVPQGSDKNEIANEAVRQQGARPIDHSEFSLNGLNWPQTSPNTVLVTQNYNSIGDPTGGGFTALQNTHLTWSGVDSDLAFGVLGSTGRCPSLVRECPEKQTSDTFNDVGWLSLKNKNTLGVTWFNTRTVEADMALNTKFTWNTNGNDFDVETVFLHENGHVIGLGHSDISDAVMFPSYLEVRRTLDPDDVCGIKKIYGEPCGAGPTPGAPTSLDITHGSHGGLQSKSGGNGDEENYVHRDTVHIFVKALDVSLVGVGGVPIQVVLVTADGRTLSGSTTTNDQEGVAHIHYKVKVGRDGIGVYEISATNNANNLSCSHPDSCHADFNVQ